MEFKFGLSQDELINADNTLLALYYDFFQNLYGKNILSFFSRRNIKTNNQESAFLYTFDELFKKTLDAVETVLNNTEDFKMVAMYSEDSTPVAFARVKLSINGDQSNAIVAEIMLLPSACNNPDEQIAIYKQIVSFIEQSITELYPGVSVLTFEVPYYDSSYAVAVEDNGYNMEYESNNSAHVTSLFDKTIRGRDELLIRKRK